MGVVRCRRLLMRLSISSTPAFNNQFVSEGPPLQVAKNPYTPTAAYGASFETSEGNPARHDYTHAALTYNLGTDAELKQVFPGGLAGDMPLAFQVTSSNSMLIRPVGVTLVQSLERFRSDSGISLREAGDSVLDPPVGYKPTSLDLPLLRGATVSSSDISFANREAATATSTLSVGESDASNNYLDVAKWKDSPLRLLVGPPGVGKSAILNYAVHYARRNSWITLFIPDSFSIMTKGLVILPSKLRPGMVDQHDIALRILQETAAAQSGLLAKVPQRGQYATFRYLPPKIDSVVTSERAALRVKEDEDRSRQRALADAAGEKWDPASFLSKLHGEDKTDIDRSTFTLADMVQWGIKHPSEATDTLLHFMEELRTVTEFPVLVAVDGLNIMYEGTEYPRDGKLLNGSQLSIPAAFQCVGPEGFKDKFRMKRGIFAGTVCRKHSNKLPMFEDNNVLHRYRVRVPGLMREEIHSLLLQYLHAGSFFMLEERSDVDALAVEYYKALSAGIPRELFRAAMHRVPSKSNSHTPGSGSKDKFKKKKS